MGALGEDTSAVRRNRDASNARNSLGLRGTRRIRMLVAKSTACGPVALPSEADDARPSQDQRVIREAQRRRRNPRPSLRCTPTVYSLDTGPDPGQEQPDNGHVQDQGQPGGGGGILPGRQKAGAPR